jgi:hypothetical protein
MAKKPVQINEGTIMMLPQGHSARLMESLLLPNPTFRAFYDHFQSHGMRFLPDRVKAAMYVPPTDSGGPFAVSPTLLVIVPSFVPMSLDGPSHEAASISVVSQGNRLGAVATQVRVGHNPFAILSFSIGERDEGGKITWKQVDPTEVEKMSAVDLAKTLGPPFFDENRNERIPNMSEKDMLNLATLVYRTLITDKGVSPPYPPAGLQSLIRETSLVERWTLTQSLRYGTLNTSGTPVPMWSLACTSTSTSCQGCSSCSTSILPKI